MRHASIQIVGAPDDVQSSGLIIGVIDRRDRGISNLLQLAGEVIVIGERPGDTIDCSIVRIAEGSCLGDHLRQRVIVIADVA